jgi:hypothetical protein
MIDFVLKKRRMGGLHIGLCAGKDARVGSQSDCVHLSEEAFSFLEPAIKRHSSQYARPYSHWGVTSVNREEWEKIIEDWYQLKERLTFSQTLMDLAAVAPLSPMLGKRFDADFFAHRTGLIRMIEETASWVREQLRNQDVISVLGV